MPYCTGCGNQVAAASEFCPRCGRKQPKTAAPDWLQSLTPSTAAALCYLPFAGWVFALLILASEQNRESKTLRFHAFQGMYLALLWLVVDFALLPFFGFAGPVVRRAMGGTLRLAALGAMLFLLYKTWQNEFVSLPFVGELAEKSAAEQGFRV